MPKNLFYSERAREMQKRSVEKRRKNSEFKAILGPKLRQELQKKAGNGSDDTLADYFVKKALSEILKSVTLKDLLMLQELLGEKQMTFNFENRNPSEVARDILEEIGE